MNELTWAQTRQRMAADRARLAAILPAGRNGNAPRVWLHPAHVCTFLYRLSNHFYRQDHRWMARAIWHLNLLLTGADISEPADLGEGLVVLHPAGVAIMGTAGRNLTIMACAGLGAEVGRIQDIGAGPGCCIVGDNVVMEPHSGILGPVRVGNRVRVGAGIALTRNVPDDTVVEAPPPRFRALTTPE